MLGPMKAPETVLPLEATRAGVTTRPRMGVSLSPTLPLGSWRYDMGEKRRRIPWLALLLSGGMHTFLLLGISPTEEVLPVVVAENNFIELIAMPKLDDLKELEPEEFNDSGEVVEEEAVSYVPMLADLPSTVKVDSFVQALDLSSLEVKPDLANAKIATIPTGVRRGGPGVGDGLKNVFSLAELDRIPEPVFQPSPVFPAHLRSEISQARVEVEFVVNASGKVVEARVVHASVSGFEDAAVSAVSRWQFRPGMKGGRRVHTRMLVPIMFRVVEKE